MLSILITLFVLSVVNFGNGIAIGSILKIKDQNFVWTSFLGMVGMTLLQTVIALVSPLDLVVEIVMATSALIGLLWFFLVQKRVGFKIKLDFWFYFFLLTIVFAASFSPYLFDHYGYYVPTVSYLKELGFVKGISNLDLLLGQTSFWHIYQAGFSHFADPFLMINSYLLLLFLVYIYERKQYFLLIFFPVFLLFVQQPSPDLPILVMALIVINELLNKKESSMILYLSVFAFCIKSIVFWLPLFVVLHTFSQKKLTLKSIIPFIVFGTLLVFKNIWLFGFPMFPVSFIDFNLPWKPSQEVLTYSSQMGMMKSYDMKYSYQQVSGFDFSDQVWHWFTIGFKSVLNIGILISLWIIAAFTLKQKKKFYYLLLICLILKTVLIICFSAQYRFFIDVYVVALFLLFKNTSKEKSVFIAAFLSIFIAIIFTFPGFVQRFNIGKQMSGFCWSQFYKPKVIGQMKVIPTYQIGNFHFNASKDPVDKVHFPALNLYDLKLYDYYGIFPQYLGKDPKDGIFQRKLKADEKIQLKKIISKTEKLKP